MGDVYGEIKNRKSFYEHNENRIRIHHQWIQTTFKVTKKVWEYNLHISCQMRRSVSSNTYLLDPMQHMNDHLLMAVAVILLSYTSN